MRKVKNTFPKTYLLEDLDGSPIQSGFYKKEPKKHYSLWLGFLRTSWI